MIAKKIDLRKIIIPIVILAATAVTLAAVLATVLAWQADKLAGHYYPNISVDGLSIGDKTQKEAATLLSKSDNDLSKVNIQVLYEKQPIATFSAQTLALRRDTNEVLARAYKVGRSSNTGVRLYQNLAALLKLQSYTYTTKILYDKKPVADFLSDAKDSYNKPAKNALFSFEGGRVTSFAPEQKGFAVQEGKFIQDFDAAMREIKQKPESKKIALKATEIEPDITLAEANNFGIEELIGQGQSNYSHSIPGRIHNVLLAASRFNGVLIKPGETFSFNDTVGDISSLTGYEQAYIIKNGKTVLGDGGGVCQVSTTLFRAALNTGLPIIERTAHAYRVGYYENDSGPGYDATVFGPTVDFKIKNDTPAYILIQTYADQANNILYFDLYGKKDGRVAHVGKATVTDQSPPPPDVNQDDPTLPNGTVKQVDFAASGAKVWFPYSVTKNGQTVFEKTFYSSYRPWAAVYLHGTGG